MVKVIESCKVFKIFQKRLPFSIILTFYPALRLYILNTSTELVKPHLLFYVLIKYRVLTRSVTKHRTTTLPWSYFENGGGGGVERGVLIDSFFYRS